MGKGKAMRPVSEQEKYLKSKVSHQPPFIDELEKRLLDDGKWGINVSAAEGAFLRFFVEVTGVKKIVEVGTQYGFSTHWFLDAHMEGLQVRTIEKQKDHYEVANEYFSKLGTSEKNGDHFRSYNLSGGKSLVSFLGEANPILQSIESEGPFDLVFIDANKGGYLDYLDWSMNNLAPGGWIVADNTFLFGSVWLEEPGDKAPKNPWKKMKEFNERLSERQSFRSFMLPTPEGLSIAQKIN